MKRRTFLQLFAIGPAIAALPAIASLPAGSHLDALSDEPAKFSARVVAFYDISRDEYIWRIDAIDASSGTQYTTNIAYSSTQKEKALELLRVDFERFIKRNGVQLSDLFAPPPPPQAQRHGIVEVVLI